MAAEGGGVWGEEDAGWDIEDVEWNLPEVGGDPGIGEETATTAVMGQATISHEVPGKELLDTEATSLTSHIKNRLLLRYDNLFRNQIVALFLLVLAVSLIFIMASLKDSVVIGEDSALVNDEAPLSRSDLYGIGPVGYIFFGLLLGTGLVIHTSIPFYYSKNVNITILAAISLYCLFPGVFYLFSFTGDGVMEFLKNFGLHFYHLFVLGLFFLYCMPVAMGMLGIFTRRIGYAAFSVILMLLLGVDAGGDMSDGSQYMHFFLASLSILIFLNLAASFSSFSEFSGRMRNREEIYENEITLKWVHGQEDSFRAFNRSILQHLYWCGAAAAVMLPLAFVFGNAHHLMTLLDSGQLRDSLEVQYLYGRVVAAYILLFLIGMAHVFLAEEKVKKKPGGQAGSTDMDRDLSGEMGRPAGAGMPMARTTDTTLSGDEQEFRRIFGE